MTGSKNRFARMKTSVATVEIPMTVEDEAKARNFGVSVESGVLFLLRRGLTNQGDLFLPSGLTNHNLREDDDEA